MPRALVIEGDSVILITHSHLKFINMKIAEGNFLQEQDSSYKLVIADLETELKNFDLIKKELETTKYTLQTDKVAYKSYISDLKAETADAFKVKRKEKRRAVITSWLIGFVAGLVASIFI